MPVIDAAFVSVAVMVWLPAVFIVAEKMLLPFTSVELGGDRTAWISLLVTCTVPVYLEATLLEASSAVTVKLNAAPTVELA